MLGFFPWTQLFGAAAATHRDNTASRKIATMPRLGYFGNFGIAANESTVGRAPSAFAASKKIHGFDLITGEFGCVIAIELLGAETRFRFVGKDCRAHLSLSPPRVVKLAGRMNLIVGRKEVSRHRCVSLLGNSTLPGHLLWVELGNWRHVHCTP